MPGLVYPPPGVDVLSEAELESLERRAVAWLADLAAISVQAELDLAEEVRAWHASFAATKAEMLAITADDLHARVK